MRIKEEKFDELVNSLVIQGIIKSEHKKVLELFREHCFIAHNRLVRDYVKKTDEKTLDYCYYLKKVGLLIKIYNTDIINLYSKKRPVREIKDILRVKGINWLAAPVNIWLLNSKKCLEKLKNKVKKEVIDSSISLDLIRFMIKKLAPDNKFSVDELHRIIEKEKTGYEELKKLGKILLKTRLETLELLGIVERVSKGRWRLRSVSQ